MRSNRSIGRAALALVAACLTLRLLMPAQSAQLSIDAAEFDFGKVPASNILKHTFRLTNTGTSILYIRDMTAT